MKKVEEKILESKCFTCNGSGNILEKDHVLKCIVCDGTGIYKEKFYYFIDEKKKIAFSSDNLA